MAQYLINKSIFGIKRINNPSLQIVYFMHLYEFINNTFNTTFSSNDHLPLEIHYKTIDKNQIITDFYDIEKFCYFLVDGIAQIGTETASSETKIIDFLFPGRFFNVYISFITQQPSMAQIKTITSCKVEYFNYSDLQKVYETSLLVNQIGRTFTEQSFIMKYQREVDFLTKSAQERYLELLSRHPDIIHQIPIKSIALYLGIHPESLSRIRKNITS